MRVTLPLLPLVVALVWASLPTPGRGEAKRGRQVGEFCVCKEKGRCLRG